MTHASIRPARSEIYRKLGEVNPAHFIDSFYSENGVFDIGNDLTRFSIAIISLAVKSTVTTNPFAKRVS